MESESRTSRSQRPTATIVICTFNRALFLRDTLRSLALLQAPELEWDVLVVDNNSRDDTAVVVNDARQSFPVPLRYVFEPRQGKSIALNTGFDAVSSAVIVYTDDDVRVPPHWLSAAVAPLTAAGGPDYTGGPVRPWWEVAPPQWLDLEGNLSGTLALLDHGAASFVFEERGTIPLGVNMAVRRSLVSRVGGFHPALGRNGNSLLGQEQAEFFQRCRNAGVRGLYVPDMWLEHHVPAGRLTASYFMRWWYWKGISQARWHAMHDCTETGVRLTDTPRVFGVPRYVLGQAIRQIWMLSGSAIRLDRSGLARHAPALMYRLGYCREVWRTQRPPTTSRNVVPPADEHFAPGASGPRLRD